VLPVREPPRGVEGDVGGAFEVDSDEDRSKREWPHERS